MAAFLAARSCSSRLATRPPSVQRPQVTRPIAVRPMRAQRMITRALDKAQVLSTVKAVVVEQLGVEPEQVTPDASFVDLNADSLDIVEIMMSLEEKFNVEIDEEKAQKITTVGQAVELLSQLEPKK